MPITVLNNVFHLRSGGSSLLMQVTPAGRLVHLYYGHLLPVGEYSIADFPPASAGPATSPTPPDDDCIDSVGTALFEYPTFGLGDFRPAAFRAVGKDGTAVTDLSALAGLTNLETLDIEGCRIDSIEPLLSLKNLRTLYAANCGLSQSEIEELGQALPNCTIYT